MADTFLCAVVEQKLHRVLTLITDKMITLDLNHLQGIRASIVAIIDMLRDADNHRTRSEPVRLWLIKLKQAVFEAEDVVAEISDNFLDEKVHSSFGGHFLRKMFAFSSPLAKKVWMTNQLLQTLRNEGMGFGLQWISSQRILPQLEDHYPTNGLIPREGYESYDAIYELFSLLANPNNQQTFTIIPIVEMLCTTRNSLANLVCRQAMEANLFDVNIWVCPPHLFDEKQICRRMLQLLTGTNTMGGLPTHDMILEKLENVLFGKRYILVLDGVGVEVSWWWDRLRACLSEVSTKTQHAIIFTTWSEQVASAVETSSKKFSELTVIRDRVDRSTMTYIDVVNGLTLVSCVEFCLRFPDVFPVQKEELVQFWIAEGLAESLEKGNMCFDALVHYCFLHGVERDENDDVVTWKIHGPTLNRINSLSKSEGLFRWKWTDQSSIYYRSPSQLYETTSMNFLEDLTSRTLISDSVLTQELLKLKSLRTLVFLNSDVEELPSSIGGLKHLRYLDVSNTRIRELPGFITKLYNLQTLRFLNCKELSNLPRKKLKNLTNLKNIAFSFEHQMPFGLGKLTGLQTLSLFVVGSDRGGSIRELKSLNELRGHMGITGLEEVTNRKQVDVANLQKKTKLNGLSFQWSYGANDRSSNDEELLESLRPHPNIQKIKIKYYMGKKLPSWLMNIGSTFDGGDSIVVTNLVGLTLEQCWNCIHLSPLGHLPCLKSLTIQHMEKLRFIEFESQLNGNFSSEGNSENHLTLFPALRSLSISGMENLLSWHYHGKNVVVFPCLERLSIQSCPKLTCFPMESLSALVKVEIKDCDELRFLFHGKKSFRRLTRLSIEGCPKLTYLRNWLLSNTGFNRFRVRRCDWIRFISDDLGLQSFLISLEINCCKALTDFADDILCKLTRLRKLSIGAFSEKLDDFSYLNKINELPSLEEIEIWGSDIFGRKMSRLPDQLQHLNHLDSLKIMGFTTMEALPEWLSDLPSLHCLSLNYCWNLEYKPTATTIQRLSNLKRLYIYGCPILENHKSELNKFSGVCWSKFDLIK